MRIGAGAAGLLPAGELDEEPGVREPSVREASAAAAEEDRCDPENPEGGDPASPDEARRRERKALGSPDAPSSSIEEVRQLFLEFGSYAERAAAAVAAGDLSGLHYALAARSAIIPRTERLLSELVASTDPAHLDVELDSLRAAAIESRAREVQLRISLATELQRITGEMHLLATEELVRTAYGQTRSAWGRRIDLLR